MKIIFRQHIFSSSVSWKTLIVLHLAVHSKRDKNSGVMNEKGELEEKFKAWLLSHVHIAGKLLCEVGVNVGLPLEKAQEWPCTPSPKIKCWKGVGEGV